MIHKPPLLISWALQTAILEQIFSLHYIAVWWALHSNELLVWCFNRPEHKSDFTNSVKIEIPSVNIFSTPCRTHIDSINNTHYSSTHYTDQSTICTKYIVYIISLAVPECLLWAVCHPYGTKRFQHPQQKPLFPRIAFQWFTSEEWWTWWGRETRRRTLMYM